MFADGALKSSYIPNHVDVLKEESITDVAMAIPIKLFHSLLLWLLLFQRLQHSAQNPLLDIFCSHVG